MKVPEFRGVVQSYPAKSWEDFCEALKKNPPINIEQFSVLLELDRYTVSSPAPLIDQLGPEDAA